MSGRVWYYVRCLRHDTSVRQHYPCRNQAPSTCFNDVKLEQNKHKRYQLSLHEWLLWKTGAFICIVTITVRLLYWCFTAIRLFSCHFGRGQLSYPHCSWASLLGSLPILSLSACSFASNWQLPFLNQRKGENGHRVCFFFHDQSPRKNVAGRHDQTRDRPHTRRTPIRSSYATSAITVRMYSFKEIKSNKYYLLIYLYQWFVHALSGIYGNQSTPQWSNEAIRDYLPVQVVCVIHKHLPIIRHGHCRLSRQKCSKLMCIKWICHFSRASGMQPIKFD